MKKILSIMLVAIICITCFVGCNNIDKPIDENESTKDTTEKVPEDTDISILTDTDNVKDTEKTGNPEDTKVDDKDTTEVKKGNIILTDDSELKTKTDFDGLYRVAGYARLSFGSSTTFVIDLEAIESENNGQVDVSETKIADFMIDIFDNVYFKSKFDGEKISDWDIVDRITNEVLTTYTDEQLKNKYFPEETFELVTAGTLPDTINLSNYEIGKTYVFDIPEDQSEFTPPEIINDTENFVMIISEKYKLDNDFERKYITKQSAPSASFSFVSSHEGKMYIAIVGPETNTLMNSDECLTLDKYNVGEMINFDFEDYVGNNTDKTITITVVRSTIETDITLAPGEIIKCSWLNDVKIKEIK